MLLKLIQKWNELMGHLSGVSLNEWQVWRKGGMRPSNVPSHPEMIYKQGGWHGYGHWLGAGRKESGSDDVYGGKQTFRPFGKSLLYARSLKLKGQIEWRAWAKSGGRPSDIPSNPNQIYKHDGWQGYEHWLGTCKIRGKFQLLHPAAPYYPFPRGKFHTRGNIWSFTVG